MKKMFLSWQLAFLIITSMFNPTTYINAETYVNDETCNPLSDYTVERENRSWYNAKGELKLSQYFDKVVLQNSSSNATRINNMIKTECEEFLSDAQENIDFTAEYPSPYDEWYSNYADAEVTQNKNGILSIKMTCVWYMGGVASDDCYGLNYNLNTGEKLNLTDVFSISAYEIEKYLKEETIKHIYDNPNRGWWNNEFQNAISIVNSKTLDDFDYYIREDDIFICYPKYELGPGAMGNVVIQCPIIKHEEIKVVLNGEEIEFDQPPIMAEGDRVMVPIRPVAEAMGDVVKWCDYLNSALVLHNDRIVVFRNDDNEACIYGDPTDKSTWDTYYCDVPPQNINEKTLTPVRAIGECLGANVDWDKDTQTVIIDYNVNTPRTLRDNALAQINALYFAYCIPESDFSEYTDDINYFCENRNGWSDAFIIWMDDWTIALDILASGEKTNVYMIKQCLAGMLSEMPDSGEFDSCWLDIHNETSSWIRKTGSLSKYTLRELLSVAPDDKGYFSRLSNEIASLGKTLKYLNVGIDYLAEVLSDYSTGMYYIDVLRTSLYNAGIEDETIHNSLNELENEYVHKYANSIYDNVIDIGSGAVLNAVTGKTFKAAEAFKDFAMLAGEAITDNKDKATHVKNLNCIYLFNDYIDKAYKDLKDTLLSDTSKLNEYMVMFNLQRIIKIKAYNAMDILSANNDQDTKDRISEQVDKLSELSYVIFE